MFLNATGYYIPEGRIGNDYFAAISGKPQDWFFQRTGMMTRSRARDRETPNYMSLKAVKEARKTLPYDIREVDLIIFASYTPFELVGTTAHIIQRHFNIEGARAFYISAACSSGVNAVEIIRSFFKTGISRKALLVCADKNTAFADDNDEQSGHLWGDAAVAMFFSAEKTGEGEIEVLDVTTEGMGQTSLGPFAVGMSTVHKKIHMNYGRDVFVNACVNIARSTNDILAANGLAVSDVDMFISHQANDRILKHVIADLRIDEGKSPSNLRDLGNTGCGSAFLVLAQNIDRISKDDLVCISVFGGGYSVGTCLMRRC